MLRAHEARDGRAGGRRGPPEGRRGLDRPHRWDPGSQADGGVDPAVPPAAAVLHRRRGARRPRGGRGLGARRGAHERPDRRGDGGADGLLGCRSDRLRHGQGRRARRHDRTAAPAREDRREGGLARAGVVTISTRVSRGEAEDESGPALAELCRAAGLDVVTEEMGDDRDAIATELKRVADHEDLRFIFTTGGTGMTADDVTPEATNDVIDREAPGYAETIRAEARGHTPLGILTRGVSGIRGRTLIVNFPGSPRAVRQSWPVVEPTLEHARDTLERS